MTAKKGNSKPSLNDPDDPVEWPDEVWDRAQISIGGKVVRAATGTLTKRGRPPIGVEAKKQVTLRLPAQVIEHFRADGPGWQSRISEALERHVEAEGRSRVAERPSEYRAEGEGRSRKE
jgi:uncharacterized protein (DUF4415 family)